MSEVSRCQWYNPCSWFSSCFEDQTGEREPLTNNGNQAPKTPDEKRVGVSTPGGTPTRSPSVQGDEMSSNEYFE